MKVVTVVLAWLLLALPVHASVDSLNALPQDALPVVVTTDFTLIQIDNIDVESETFAFSGILTMSWFDARQRFDPVAEQVSEKLYIGAYQFNEVFTGWWPQITLVNEAGRFDSDAVVLRVRPDGTLLLTQTVNAIAKASLDLRLAPFDRQHLDAVFQVVDFDTSEVMLRTFPSKYASGETLDAQYHLQEWTVDTVGLVYAPRLIRSIGVERDTSAIVLGVEVTRDPLFYLRLLIFPMAVMVILSWSVFWMDRSSIGDRLNVSFIGILTAVAYQMMLDDALPQISYMTMLNGFLTISFFTMCASVLINLRVSFLDRQGRVVEGDALDRRCRWLFPAIYFGLLLLLPVVIGQMPPPG